MFKKGTYTGHLIPEYDRDLNRMINRLKKLGKSDQEARETAESVMSMYAHQYREVRYS